jgi:hypothetical protein
MRVGSAVAQVHIPPTPQTLFLGQYIEIHADGKTIGPFRL